MTLGGPPPVRARARGGAWARLGLLTALLLAQTACLEDFQRLVTTVVYDPYEHVYQVERRLIGVEPSFFQCDSPQSCEAAISRAVRLQPSETLSASLADRLVNRLLDTDAQDLRIRVERQGDRLDALVTYRAAVGSKAAADTLVHAEWGGKRGRERYYLTVEAQDSMDPPGVPYEVRKQSFGAAGGGWREFWVLPPRVTEITTTMHIDAEAVSFFEAVPGADGALRAAGLLGGDGVARVEPGVPDDVAVEEPAVAPPGPVVAPPVVEVEPVAPEEPAQAEGPEEVAPPEPEEPEEPASVAPPVAEPPPPSARSVPPGLHPDPVVGWKPSAEGRFPGLDPSSPAKTWVHPLRITGDLPEAVAQRAVAPLIPRVELCYQQRQGVVPDLAGYAFLNARVRGDGWLVGTSVYGEIPDVQLLRCLEDAILTWTFPPWGEEGALSEVDVPLTFRVEPEPEPKKGRKRAR